ncbi:MAG TPA: TetR/AcrR family transcriptional regulator, partial [Solirubrobacteraceae bacterium]|nr:TetR/AcrR family transcriptional regulator [Solirubrobacteraceae bacterium]
YSQAQRGTQSTLPELVDDLVRWATSYSGAVAMIGFRDPAPNRPSTSDGLWGGRAPGTLSRGTSPKRSGDRATHAQGFSRTFLVHRQRERILDAVADLTAKLGYSALTIEGIAHEAGVSTASFHQQFTGREDAFLVAYEVGHAKGMAIVERAFFRESDWQAGVRAGISALLDFLASEPSFARMALVDALIATRRSAVRSRRGANAYAQMLLPGLERAPQSSTPSGITIDAIAGGVFELCLSYSLKGRIAELSELAPRATYFVLAPFIGTEAAARIATEPPSERSRT